MSDRYYVVGGEYADITFSRIASGAREERFGPFSEREAHECWRAVTGKTVDNAMVRYFIRSEEEILGDSWYVIGGEYADTSFTAIAEGGALERWGPFPRQAAMAKWRELTGRSVDSCLTRYDLFTADEMRLRGLDR